MNTRHLTLATVGRVFAFTLMVSGWSLRLDAQNEERRINMTPDPLAEFQEDSRRTGRITLDVKDKDLAVILQSISKRVGVNVIADPEINETVTIRLENMDWREALEAIARQTHCRIVERSGNYIRFTQPPSISMEFQNADLRVVLELLAKQSGANILIAEEVKGNVSLSLRDVPWQDALEAIVKTNGYTIVRADTADTEIIRVVHPSSLDQQLETRHFTLKYVRPSDPYSAVITNVEAQARSSLGYSATSGALESGGGGRGGEGDGQFSLKVALENMLSKNGKLDYDFNTNSIIVKDIKPKLDEIGRVIRLLDVEPPLIYVEVKFISTSTTDILEYGVKFDQADTPERDGIEIIARGASPNPVATDPLFLFGGTYPFNIADFNEPLGDFQALGILDFTKIRALFKLLKDDESSRVIQEPSLTVVNNQAATIFVGDTIPFAVQKIRQDQNGNVAVTIDENKRSPINVGFTLYLIPHVIPGTDLIDLTVIPNVSRLSGTTSPGVPGFERFAFEQEGTENSAFIDLPRESKQTVVTYLRVPDRQTAVIGGLHSQEKREIETRIPILSDIPLLGNLLTWKRKSTAVKSLIILITPHILRDTAESRDVFEDAERRHRDRDYFWNKYEKDRPESPE